MWPFPYVWAPSRVYPPRHPRASIALPTLSFSPFPALPTLFIIAILDRPMSFLLLSCVPTFSTLKPGHDLLSARLSPLFRPLQLTLFFLCVCSSTSPTFRLFRRRGALLLFFSSLFFFSLDSAIYVPILSIFVASRFQTLLWRGFLLSLVKNEFPPPLLPFYLPKMSGFILITSLTFLPVLRSLPSYSLYFLLLVCKRPTIISPGPLMAQSF